MITHNVWFYGEIRRILSVYPIFFGAMSMPTRYRDINCVCLGVYRFHIVSSYDIPFDCRSIHLLRFDPCWGYLMSTADWQISCYKYVYLM